MGVPKFFRYISERYPCLSETIKEFQIPDFDNLYLDMNGIIHTCSHPDDNDPHFRITEEQIFKDIFHYLEVLFRMIQPRKVFFLAIDGVAPRAKMNQQRGRRFRSAKDAELMEQRAKAKGEELPDVARFDSNCITPGTVFMARLHEQLKYFIVNKISNDKSWQKCSKIILSGHETPGEGEHKIMDYIRYLRSQPGYDPNTRHCLYGLDADLIMLGLCTHEPHFSLLREEVKFGKKAKRTNVPEQITFFLLHLSLMREYLELEFQPVRDSLPFKYDIEKIIDDWVLMGFLIGNDFIPHLPNLHIHNNVLPVLYATYMKVLPSMDGYINENGKLNLSRFSKFMDELGQVDIDAFQETYADLKYFEGKTDRKMGENFTKPKTLEAFFDDGLTVLDNTSASTSKDLADLIKNSEDMFEDDEEVSENETDGEDFFQSEFKQHKTDYYMNKLDYAKVTPEVLRDQAEGYVRAIQWNLHYYYNGCCSWSWYYPHHYAPYITDIKDFSNLDIKFDLGKPFYPFQQLLAVLPAASKELLPDVYQKLMTEETSSIIKYYPTDFETDLNGKRQEWEAVVLIPFIEEKELLNAMDPCDKKLTDEEKKRNSHGPMLVYEYSTENKGPYEAPKYFPRVSNNFTNLTPLTINDVRVPVDKLIKGAYPGAKFDVYFPGFPTFKHLKYAGSLEKKGVKVFDQASRSENMILNIIKEPMDQDLETIAQKLLGRIVYVNWPHLTEAKVLALTNDKFRYEYNTTLSTEKNYQVIENKGDLFSIWKGSIKMNDERYMTRLGINIGKTDVIVHVQLLIGRSYIWGNSGKFSLEKQWAAIPSTFPYQAIVQDIAVHDPNFIQHKDVSQIYPIGGLCFMLGFPHYASQGTVIDHKDIVKTGRIKVTITAFPEPDLTELYQIDKDFSTQYMSSYNAAQRLGINVRLFSRITGCIFVIPGEKSPHMPENVPKTNIGLNLKFNKRNEEIPGYTKKNHETWLYSSRAVQLVKEYMEHCPELFDFLAKASSRGGGADVYFESEIFPDNLGEDKIKNLAAWIKKQPYTSIEPQTCGSQVLDPEVIALLEEKIDEHLGKNNKGQIVCMQVKSRLLYMPQLNMGHIAPDSRAEFQLYDRVINVRDGYSVPLGIKGTLVGIHEPKNTNSATNTPDPILYDILFDEAFTGGMALNCSKNRGYRLSAMSLLNISHGQRIEERKKSNLVGDPKANSQDKTNAWRKIGPNQPGSAFAPFNKSDPKYAQEAKGNFPPPPVPEPSKKTDVSSLPSYAGPPARKNAPKKGDNIKTSVNEFQAIWDQLHDLGKKKKENKTIETKVESAKPKTPELAKELPVKDIPDLIPNKPSTDSSTEILKLMLKIKDEPPVTPPVKPLKPTNPHEDASYAKPIVLEDLFKLANVKLEPQTPLSYTVELLTKFQQFGLGVPRYNYLQGADRTIRTQIFLPSGQNVIGGPALTKEAATELVAQLVLQDPNLLAQPRMVPFQQFNSGLPAPPQQWFQRNMMAPPFPRPQMYPEPQFQKSSWKKAPESQPPKDTKCDISGFKNQSHKMASDVSTPEVPFVPLQAIKKQKNRTLSNKSDEVKTPPKNGNNTDVSRTDASMDNGQNKNKNQTPGGKANASGSTGAQKRIRKSRIAANFSGMANS